MGTEQIYCSVYINVFVYNKKNITHYTCGG